MQDARVFYDNFSANACNIDSACAVVADPRVLDADLVVVDEEAGNPPEKVADDLALCDFEVCVLCQYAHSAVVLVSFCEIMGLDLVCNRNK